jgi:hypothetical protein
MTAPSLARRIADPRSWENGVLSSAAIGALTLVDPARLSRGQRLLHRGAVAGLAGVAALLEVRAAPSYAWQDPVARAGLPVGAAGLMLGMAEVRTSSGTGASIGTCIGAGCGSPGCSWPRLRPPSR